MEFSLIRFAPLLGRLLLSTIFVVSGIGKISDWSGTAATMAAAGFIAAPFFLNAAIVMELLGGASLIVGAMARWGAGMLIIYVLTATCIFHAFWSVGPEEFRPQLIHFLKNLCITGGLFMVVAHGAGAYSVDHWLERRAARTPSSTAPTGTTPAPL